MDGNACLMELSTGIKVDYSRQIKCFCIGGERDKYDYRIAFYELRPQSDEFVWVELLPGNTCLRANVMESGKTERSKLEALYQSIQELDVRRTYG